MTQHVCTNATLAGAEIVTGKKGEMIAVIYTCSVCGAKHRRNN
jgi:hypothetical protein